MTDERGRDSTDSEGTEEHVERAESLIAVDGLWSGRILYAAVELGLLSLLADGPRSASHVAAERDLDAEKTYRLLRALAHFDVLEENQGRQFRLTPVGELFTNDHPQSKRSDLLFNRSPEWERAMLHLPGVVEAGEPTGFVREFGCEFFEYVRDNPEFGDVYNDLIEHAARTHPDAVHDALDGYDFSRFSHVCDVGGGRGRLLGHILAANPHLHGTVLDLPSVVAEDDGLWAGKLGVADRCRYVGGDMFESVPEADAYVLKWMLHNFDDERCQEVLSNVHEAAPPDGRLFVVETVVPDPRTSHDVKRLDVAMMVQTGGRERTRDEYAALFERAGWELVETWVPDDGSLTVLEAGKT